MRRFAWFDVTILNNRYVSNKQAGWPPVVMIANSNKTDSQHASILDFQRLHQPIKVIDCILPRRCRSTRWAKRRLQCAGANGLGSELS